MTEPVRLHVDAKRYLCATEPGYLELLSPGLGLHPRACRAARWQGDELARFAASPHAADACRVRRWDDAAKDPAAPVPPLEPLRARAAEAGPRPRELTGTLRPASGRSAAGRLARPEAAA